MISSVSQQRPGDNSELYGQQQTQQQPEGKSLSSQRFHFRQFSSPDHNCSLQQEQEIKRRSLNTNKASVELAKIASIRDSQRALSATELSCSSDIISTPLPSEGAIDSERDYPQLSPEASGSLFHSQQAFHNPPLSPGASDNPPLSPGASEIPVICEPQGSKYNDAVPLTDPSAAADGSNEDGFQISGLGTDIRKRWSPDPIRSGAFQSKNIRSVANISKIPHSGFNCTTEDNSLVGFRTEPQTGFSSDIFANKKTTVPDIEKNSFGYPVNAKPDSPKIPRSPVSSQANGCGASLVKNSSSRSPRLHKRTGPETMMSHSPNFLCVEETEDDLSDWESPIDIDLADPPARKNRQSSWRKIRSFILWSPFIQVFKKHRYPWIQLAGHQGNFHAGEAGSVLKKLDSREQACFQKLMSDSLKDFVPEYRGDVEKNGETYIQLQDLLCSFNHPCVMDVKMGVRTYLEDELHKARRSPTLRKDMYQKMIEIDNSAPTTDEHKQMAVTKPRYMQWRDEMSSSVELGFRVEGIKKSDGNSSKDFKKTKTRASIVDILRSFVGDNETIVNKYIQRLKDIAACQENSEFFQSHEVIGSSLLFVHDADENVNVWMIDFGKTEPLPKGVKVDHRSTWNEGNHEDGYLFGLDNLVSIFQEVHSGLTSSSV